VTLRLYPSRNWYSTKRPRRDERLSWPSCVKWARLMEWLAGDCRRWRRDGWVGVRCRRDTRSSVIPRPTSSNKPCQPKRHLLHAAATRHHTPTTSTVRLHLLTSVQPPWRLQRRIHDLGKGSSEVWDSVAVLWSWSQSTAPRESRPLLGGLGFAKIMVYITDRLYASLHCWMAQDNFLYVLLLAPTSVTVVVVYICC